jgi:hypothetical protein
MNKPTKYGIIAGIGNTIFDAYQQYNELKKQGLANSFSEFWENYDGWRGAKKAAIGGAIGATTGFVVQKIQKNNIENTQPFNQNNYLSLILKENAIDRTSKAYQEDQYFLTAIQSFCVATFGKSMIDNPLNAGSNQKRTAIQSSDNDLVLQFKKSAPSLSELHEIIEEELSDLDIKKIKIRRQNRSIGLFREREDGTFQKIDIVPAKERGNYHQTKDLTIWDSKRESHLKTNIHIHNSEVRGMPEIRDVIKLLKAYKETNGLEIPTPLMSRLLIDGFNRRPVSSSKAANFKVGLEILINGMDRVNVRDFANGNNNLISKLSDFTRTKNKKKLLNDLELIEENPRNFKKLFSNE